MKKTLGLDLGIASIGWCLFEDDDQGNHERIIDLGSFVFNQIENREDGKKENAERRAKRSMRRQRRRKARRLGFARNLFKNELGISLFDEKGEFIKLNERPMDIKIRGLKEKLTKEEFCVALYHYIKYRGFKSNRKNANQSKEDGAVLKCIAQTREQLGSKHVTEYLLEKTGDRETATQKGVKYHNADNEFNLTIDRDWYRQEICDLIDKQIEFGLVPESFKDKYLFIYDRQRDCTDGPDEHSPFHHDIGKLIGKCVYDNEECLAKDSHTARKFVFLSSLAHFSYDGYDENGVLGHFKLTADQIKKAMEKCFGEFGASKVTYQQIIKATGISCVLIKGCRLSKKTWKAEYAKFCKNELYKEFREIEHISDDVKISGLSQEQQEKLNNFLLKNASYKDRLTQEQWERFDEIIQKKILGQDFLKNSKFLEELKKKSGFWDELKARFTADVLDAMAYISIRAKTDERIRKVCVEDEPTGPLANFTLEERSLMAETLISMENEAKQAIDLSKGVADKIIPLLEQGIPYTNALYKSDILKKGERTSSTKHIGGDAMPPIEEALKEMQVTLRNPVVKHTLVQLRRLLNCIIKEYGKPDEVYVETGRELKKNFSERRQLMNDQLEARDNAIGIRFEILRKYPTVFKSINEINRDAVLRYRLYKEQHGYSPYTNEPINESLIFSRDRYEIDHIVPRSRSFDDSFNNKALVETEQNRKKGNKLPYEYLGTLDTIDRFLSEHHISNRKKVANLRLKAFNREDADFLSGDASDNSYISRLARQLVEAYVLEEGKQCHAVSGAMTEKVRSLWHLGGCTHSYVDGACYPKYRVRAIDDCLYKSMEHNGKSITFNLVAKDVGKKGKGAEKVFDIKKNEPSGKKELSTRQKEENGYIDNFIKNFDTLNAKFVPYTSLNDIAANSKVSVGDASQALEAPEYQTYVISRLWQAVSKELDKKDRSNHLHHAIDAAVIASCTPSIIKRISDYFQEEEIANEKLSAHITMPYEAFEKELKLRVYERDPDILLVKLAELSNYKDRSLTAETVHVLYPARLPSKDIKGAISKETVYGATKDGLATKRLSVSKIAEKNKDKSLSNIVCPPAFKEAMIKAIEAWLAHPSGQYPLFDKRWKGTTVKTPIKKVTVYVGTVDSKLSISDKEQRLVDQSKVVRVRIYKKKDGSDDSLYFAPIYYFQMWREKENARRKAAGKKPFSDVPYDVMWKRGDNGSCKLSSQEIEEKFSLVAELNRYSLIELTMRDDGRHCLAYSGGASSGLFQIYSIIGDNYDIYRAGLIGQLEREQLLLTVSTIKDVKLKNISPIGKIR